VTPPLSVLVRGRVAGANRLSIKLRRNTDETNKRDGRRGSQVLTYEIGLRSLDVFASCLEVPAYGSSRDFWVRKGFPKRAVLRAPTEWFSSVIWVCDLEFWVVEFRYPGDRLAPAPERQAEMGVRLH
jgi:hypothetical protein